MASNQRESAVDPIEGEWILDSGDNLWENLPSELVTKAQMARAIERLRQENPEWAFLIDRVYYEQVSYRDLAWMMGYGGNPSTIHWRLQQYIFPRLGEILLEIVPALKERMKINDKTIN